MQNIPLTCGFTARRTVAKEPERTWIRSNFNHGCRFTDVQEARRPQLAHNTFERARVGAFLRGRVAIAGLGSPSPCRALLWSRVQACVHPALPSPAPDPRREPDH